MDMRRHSLQNARRSIVGLLKVLLVAGVVTGLELGRAAPPAQAAGSVVVDRLDDPTPIPSACTSAGNDCSLRGAIIYANAHPNTEIILQNAATYTLAIPASGADDATTGDLNITADTNIDFGPACLIGCHATVQGGAGWSDRIFQIGSGAHVQVVGLTISKGNVSSFGGGIMNVGTLTLTSCTVSGNTATDFGGGIDNPGTLTLNGTTVTNNLTTRDGGGIANYNGTLTIANSSIISNTAVSATFSGGGGLYDYAGAATISNSTIALNTTGREGGGIFALGPMTLTNTSVLTNTAMAGGGIRSGGPLTITGGEIRANTTSAAGGGLHYSGPSTAVINGTSISGNQANHDGGGIYTYLNGVVSLTSATVANNQVLTASYAGGGIYASGSSLILQTNTSITGNSVAGGWGAGIFINSGNLTMTKSTVSANTNPTSGFGGGIFLATTASTIMTSTISNNTISGGGGGSTSGGGLYLQSGALTVTASTISGNSVSGTSAYGGGLSTLSSAGMTIVGSTFYNNSARNGGGIYAAGPATITNSTISGNTATSLAGGGLEVPGAFNIALVNVTITGNQAPNSGGGGMTNAGTITLKNSLLAGNTSSSAGPDCNGTLTSQGYNLLGISTNCGGLTNGVNGDQVGTSGSPLNPYVVALANNGGPTMTHALLINSPAIEAGNPTSCPATDQRGVARPQFVRCDIGAYEYNGPGYPVPHITGLSPSSATGGDPGFTLTVNGSGFVSNSVVRWNGLDRTTSYVNSGQLTAQISAGDIAFPGTKNVTVFNSTPGGGTSNAAAFTVSPSPSQSYLYFPLIEK